MEGIADRGGKDTTELVLSVSIHLFRKLHRQRSGLEGFFKLVMVKFQ
jgi:hypothetical protein